MNDIDDTGVGPALRDRLAAEHPDLEHLAATSLAAGQGLRRRRRLGVVAGAVAGVAVIVGGTAVLAGGGSPTTAEEPPALASSPSADPTLSAGQVVDLGDGLTGTVRADQDGAHVVGASMARGSGTGFTVVASGPSAQLEEWLSSGWGTLTTDWPGVTVAVSLADAEALGMLGKVDEVPAEVGAGWTCEWFLADDKAACTAADGGVAGLVIRDAADRDGWLADPDKGNTPSVFTTEAHDGIFISVQGGRGTTNAEIRELGESLQWVD